MSGQAGSPAWPEVFSVARRTASRCIRYGVRQYLSQQPVLHLYGWSAAKLSDWFTERFPAEYHRKRLFDEPSDALLNVGPFERREGAPAVSSRNGHCSRCSARSVSDSPCRKREN